MTSVHPLEHSPPWVGSGTTLHPAWSLTADRERERNASAQSWRKLIHSRTLVRNRLPSGRTG